MKTAAVTRKAQALDGIVHLAFHFLASRTCGDTAVQVGRIRGESRRSFFDDDQVAAHFSCDCLRILLSVPGDSHESALGGVLELAVTPARPVETPAVGFDELDGFADFHWSDSHISGFSVNWGGGSSENNATS